MDNTDVQVIFRSSRKIVVRLLNQSVGTGETLVTKVDQSVLVGPAGGPSKRIVIEKMTYDINGMTVKLYWDHTPDLPIGVFSGQWQVDYKSVGGLPDPSKPPYNGPGSILLSTQDASNGDSYDILLHLRLKDM